ncbi:MAG TPA: glucose-1-phosphate cytidylyltransferase [Candidatus Bathyarchaeia archaeon]|nr:glucose-1-phosphate cytidylyltransferase [Candidatus Bathyarchaeia archaeon]
MKVVILCGGKGTRIREISEMIPKPMLPIGEKPMLWHIMKIYSHYGINDFILCLGYRGWVIKEFFLNYCAKLADVTVSLNKHDSAVYHNSFIGEDWKVTLVETGEDSMTGARVWKARKYLKDEDIFGVTYGDGLSDINIKALLRAHKKSKALGTVTGVYPSSRFGEIKAEKKGIISEFDEKPAVGDKLIGGGYMFFNKEVFNKYFRDGEDLVLESEVLPKMVQYKKLHLYKHRGFWQCIDTPREFDLVNKMWRDGKAPWKIWK